MGARVVGWLGILTAVAGLVMAAAHYFEAADISSGYFAMYGISREIAACVLAGAGVVVGGILLFMSAGVARSSLATAVSENGRSTLKAGGALGPSVTVPTSSPPSPKKSQFLSNGDFSCWSRGAVFEDVGPYQETADGWVAAYGGGGADNVLITRVDGPIGSDAPASYRYDMRGVGTGQGWNGIAYTTPDISSLAGRDVCVSFKARASAQIDSALNIIQILGDPTNERRDHWISIPPIGTEWSDISGSISLASLNDKPLGPNARVVVLLNLPTSGPFWIEVAAFRLE